MPLKLTLKPNEKAIIGGASIQNGPKGASFVINNDTVILREKDILTEETANTPAKRIYYVVQLMYLCGTLEQSKEYHPHYFEMAKAFMEACPNEDVLALINEIGTHLLDGKDYLALKAGHKLIDYEKSIIDFDELGAEQDKAVNNES